MRSTITCPVCNAQLQLPSSLQPGTEARCPSCSNIFQIPQDTLPAEESVSARRESDGIATTPTMPPRTQQVTDEADAPRRREGDQPRYPENDEDYPHRFYRDYDGFSGPGRTGPLSNEYEVELGHWIGIAQAHFNGQVLLAALYYLCMVVFTGSLSLVAGVAASVLPFSDLAINFIVTGFIGGPLAAGLVIVALRQLKGEPWHFGHFFGGLNSQRYLTLVGFSFLQELVTQLPLLPAQVLMALNKNPGLGNQDVREKMMLAAGSALLIGLLFSIFFSIRLTLFAQQLILDRQYGTVDALKGNWELTDGHFWSLFGVRFVLGLVIVGGVLLCGIGVLFAVPFTTFVLTAGYLLIAGSRPPLDKPRQPEFEYDRFDR